MARQKNKRGYQKSPKRSERDAATSRTRMVAATVVAMSVVAVVVVVVQVRSSHSKRSAPERETTEL